MTRTHKRQIVIVLLIGAYLLMVPAADAANPSFDLASSSAPTLIRMHVIAHSDHPDDQDLKELVRGDLIAWLAGTRLAQADITFTEALMELESRLPGMEQVARNRLALAGSEQDVRVRLGVFAYDERTYLGNVIPSGAYLSVEVVLGAGEGRNFWCILFPGMCFVPDEVQELAQERAKGNIAEAAAPSDAPSVGQPKTGSRSTFRFGWLWLDRLFATTGGEAVAQSSSSN